MTATAAEVAAVLRGAADVIGERGLSKYTSEDKTGAVCAYRAICYAAARPGLFATYFPAGEALRAHVISNGERNITSWVARPDVTAEDVILALKRAAETVETQGLPS